MSKLLNSSSQTETITTYDRTYAGSFDNPLNGAPSLQFFMESVSVNDKGDMVSRKEIDRLVESYTGKCTYQMYNPTTGDAIDGVTFTSDQLYAMLYSVMRACEARG